MAGKSSGGAERGVLEADIAECSWSERRRMPQGQMGAGDWFLEQARRRRNRR